jgi:hypothetical protein
MIECWQHLIDQQLDRRQPREAAAVKHKIVDPQLDKRLHLFDELRGRADKVLFHLVRGLFPQLQPPCCELHSSQTLKVGVTQIVVFFVVACCYCNRVVCA